MAKRRRTRRTKGTGSLYQRGGVWYAAYVDGDGQRIKRSTGTTDEPTARRILGGWTERAALIRGGLATRAGASLAAHARKPVQAHLADYAAHCEHAGQSAKHRAGKSLHLHRYTEGEGIKSLADLSSDSLTRHLASLRAEGKSARCCNASRASCIAFARWCVRTGRLPANPLVNTPTHDESSDKRYTRRALTPEEIGRLLAEADKRGRWLVYGLGLFAGLRRGDLVRLKWASVDLSAGVMTITGGKAKRRDELPIHPMLLARLRDERERVNPGPDDRVIPAVPDYTTIHADLRRAGIPRVDDAGQRVDLHAMRTTLGTMLADGGVPIHHAKRMLRHSSVSITEAHYTRLLVDDTRRAAMGVLDGVGRNWGRIVSDAPSLGMIDDGKAPDSEPETPKNKAPEQRWEPLGGGKSCGTGSGPHCESARTTNGGTITQPCIRAGKNV